MQLKRYHLTALAWTTKWRNWCRTNLGLETAPIKSFVSKTRFVSLGSYCALPSIAGKLQIEVIEVTLHGARELPILTWPVAAANGVIVLCIVVFRLELFMRCASQQTTRVHRLCKSLQHVLPSVRVQRPMTDLEMFSWGGVAQALQSLGFRGEAGPFDWMRTRCEAVTWNNSSGCTTQTKIKVEAISRIHDTWQDHCTVRTTRLSLSYTNHVCLTKKCLQIGHVSHFLLWGDSFGGKGLRGHTWKPLKYL